MEDEEKTFKEASDAWDVEIKFASGPVTKKVLALYDALEWSRSYIENVLQRFANCNTIIENQKQIIENQKVIIASQEEMIGAWRSAMKSAVNLKKEKPPSTH